MDTSYTIGGQKIIATLSGDPNNPPIFLIHGWMSHRGVWRQTIPALEQKYYCVAVDLLGFGASDKPEKGDYSIATQGRRILGIADHLGFKTFSLIGHSMGGQIAMCIAAMLTPERVDKLVSVAGVVTGQLSEDVEKKNVKMVEMARNRPWIYGIANSLTGFRPYINWAFKPWFFDIEKIPSNMFKEDITAALNRACHISSAEAGIAIHALDLSKQIHKVKARTLIISGAEDATVPVDQAYLAQTLITNSDLAIIQKCGHFPMYEKTNQYLKAIALIF